MSSLKLHWPLTLVIATLVLIISGFYPSQPANLYELSEEAKMSELMSYYEKEYGELDIPTLTLSYEQNLREIGKLSALKSQHDFFEEVQLKLSEIKPALLPKTLRIEYDIIHYETALNLERIQLSKDFHEYISAVNDQGIFHQKNGKSWYEYYIKRWTSDKLTPSELTSYGKAEVKRIKNEMEEIKASSGVADFDQHVSSDQFFTHDYKKVEYAFKEISQTVEDKLFISFPDFPDLPDLAIKRGTNPQLAQVPGFYNNSTFYYNLFDEPFDFKDTDWLFIHEGNPGHHFQLNYESMVSVPSYRHSISYSGFREGWAAYVEDLGSEVGLFLTPFQYYNKLEWDLIRSTRVILDVGINYYGWSNDRALNEWKKYISGLDDIGNREIARMRRWPAQVLTYKLGSKVMKEMRVQLEEKNGTNFNLKDFHTKLLSQRSIPVMLIPQLFEDQI